MGLGLVSSSGSVLVNKVPHASHGGQRNAGGIGDPALLLRIAVFWA
jgi:hypothetical protein